MITSHRFPILASVCIGLCLGVPAGTASAQDSTGREVVQPLPTPQVQRLNRALLELARRPRSVRALLEAGDASLAVDDLDAAIGFYGRAADIEPNNSQARLGLGKVYLRAGRPLDALPFLNAALSSGASARDVLSEQALAFDLIGDQASAQAAYARAVELNPQDDEARRRLAISFAINGNQRGFENTLAPMLEARNPAAFRARAFGLAILGRQEEAVAIVNEAMPRDLATRINPYLAYMPRLTAAQQAAAANLGIFPQAANIGRDDPRLARFNSEGLAGSRLEPSGEPLGAPVAVRSEEVTQEVPVEIVAAAQRSQEAENVSAPEPGFDLASEGSQQPAVSSNTERPVELAQADRREEATTPARQTVSQPAPVAPPASVADAFADLGDAELPDSVSSQGAVDLATIDIPREAEEPAEPEHPRRIWVQLATGRDVDALAFDWRRFSRRAPELLGDFKPHVTPWGQANRLLAGPVDSRADARALINALGEKGIETFSYTSPEGTEIQILE